MRTRARKKPIHDPMLSALKPESGPDNDEFVKGGSSYVAKDSLGLRGNLTSKPRCRPTLYVMLALATVVGVALNGKLSLTPTGITTAFMALARSACSSLLS